MNKDLTILFTEFILKNQTFLVGPNFKTDVFFEYEQGVKRQLAVITWNYYPFSDPECLRKVSEYFAEIVKRERIEAIIGAATAGIAYAALIADITQTQFGFCRKEKKTYGSKKALEGYFKQGTKAVLVDNFLHTGSTALKMIEFIREEGLKINDIFVLQDFPAAKDRTGLDDMNVHSAVDIVRVRELLNEKGYFPGDLYKHIKGNFETPLDYYVGSPKYEEFLEELRKAPDRKYIIQPA